MKDKRFDIRLSDNDRAMLQAIAADMNRTQSDAMRQLIRQAYAKLQENPMSNQTNHITAKWLKDAIENPSPDESYLYQTNRRKQK